MMLYQLLIALGLSTALAEPRGLRGEAGTAADEGCCKNCQREPFCATQTNACLWLKGDPNINYLECNSGPPSEGGKTDVAEGYVRRSLVKDEGKPLKDYYRVDLATCAKLCNQLSNCNSFAYTSEDPQQCHLKSKVVTDSDAAVAEAHQGFHTYFKKPEDKPKPEEEKPTPEQEQPKPEEEKPKPEQEQPTPEQEQPKPEEEKPKPEQEQPTPEQEQPKPEQEKPTPEQEQPKPEEEKPAPEQEQPKPEEEKPKPEEEKPTPEQEQPKPEEEKPKPEQEQPKPDEEKPKPEAEKPTPEQEQPKPEAEKPKPEEEKPEQETPQGYIKRGLVEGEGNKTLAAVLSVDVKTCALFCDTLPTCNSFAFTPLFGGSCQLLDKVVTASEKSATADQGYHTYYKEKKEEKEEVGSEEASEVPSADPNQVYHDLEGVSSTWQNFIVCHGARVCRGGWYGGVCRGGFECRGR